jgi:hypothetical protein
MLGGIAICSGIFSGARFGKPGHGVVSLRYFYVPLMLNARFYRPKLEALADSSAQWPLLNILGSFLRDWMPLIDEYYYCESASDLQHRSRHLFPCADTST